MRKVLAILALGLLVGSLATAAKFRTFAEIQKSGKVIIGTEGEFPPFNYFDEKNNLVGFDIDIGNALAKKLGLKPEWKAQPFDTLLIALNQGRFDFVIASHTITPERAKAVDFTKPYYCTGNVIVAKPGGPKTPEELKGKKVAVQVGTTYYDWVVENVPGVAEVKTFPTNPAALEALLSGRVDAWVTDQFTALEVIKKRGVKLQISDLLNKEEIGIAVAKGNQGLLTALNNALDAILKDGTYEQISMKWFGKDIRCK